MKPLSAPDMSEYLKWEHFDALAKAIMTAAPSMDDKEDLSKPSNAIKFGYHIKRMISTKIALARMNKRRVRWWGFASFNVCLLGLESNKTSICSIRWTTLQQRSNFAIFERLGEIER